MKINKEVYVLKLTSSMGGSEEFIYPVALKDKDSLILIDTGFPGLFESIHNLFKEENLDISKLSKIVLTHQDIDHIGNAKLLKRESEGVIEILCHEDEADYIEGKERPLKLKEFEKKLKFMPEGAEKIYRGMERGFEMCKVKVDETLKDGEVIPFIGGVTIIHTPGHTLGHICLYLNKHKILIAGDTLVIKDGKIQFTDDSYNFNSDENKRSVEKLLNYDIDKIVCYHAGVFEGNIKSELKKLLS